MEYWKKINENKDYEISSRGGLKKNGELTKISLLSGYPRKSIKIGFKKRKDFLLHRLVAKYFIGPCPKNQEVDHIDGNRKNNNVENLRYVTRKGNAENRARLGRTAKGSNHPNAVLNEKKVLEIRKLHKAGLSYSVLAKKFNVSKPTIAKTITMVWWKDVK